MAVDSHEAFNELVLSLAEVLVNVGIIDSISERWPEEVQQNWLERIESAAQWGRDQVREAQEFASSYD